MKIDLDSISEPELRELHREISHRLHMRAFARTKAKLMAFRVGDRVAFESNDGTIEGIVTRLNQKTATIQGDDDRSWRVSPGLLSKIVGHTASMTHDNLFSLADRKRD